MMILVLGLRGFAAMLVLTTLVGGIPRVAQLALAVTLGLWSGLLVASATAGGASGGLAEGAVAASAGVSVAAALYELAIGAAMGVMGAVPLLAASTAGRLVDIAATGRAQGPYSLLFGVLAAAVFVGIDGHVAVLAAIVESHRAIGSLVTMEPRVVAAIAQLIPVAVRLAVPWLVTAAVVHIAIGVGTRIATRAGAHAPAAAAVPAALVMMTASLVATLAIAMAAIMRGTL